MKKGYKMGHNHGHTKKIGWTIILNLIITISEYIGGVISGSLSLISDSGHNLSDVLALVLNYFGEKLSNRKTDKKHTFGFKRVEVFTALINALALWIIGVIIIIEAINRFGKIRQISLGAMVGVGFIGLFGNVFSVLILNKDKDKNFNMKSAYLHLFYDAISALAIIVTGIIIYYTHFYVLDLIVSILISFIIIFSGFKIVKASLHIFMQGVPADVNIEDINKLILKLKHVIDVHNIHIWNIDSNEVFFSAHVCVGNSDEDNDNIISKINLVLRDNYNINHTTIQIEKNKCSNVHGESS